MKQARLARWLWPLLLVGMVAGARAQDDDEWDPAGDHKKIKPKAAATQPTDPTVAEALRAAANSPGLQTYVPKLAEVNTLALQGDYPGALQRARKYASEVAAVKVTGEFVKPRAALTAAFTILVGEMEALTDSGLAANRSFGSVSLMQVSDELKAMAMEAEATAAALDYDFNRAAGLERRAYQQSPTAIAPALDGAATLFGGRPDAALESLKASLGKGQNNGLTSLYAAAAALAMSHGGEAATYFSRPETSATAIWPQFYLVAGLLDGATGSPAIARAKFDEGARRELGRVKANTALAAVAQMASGDVQAGAVALARVAQSTPNNFRAPLVDLLTNPSQAAALKALANPKYWLTSNGYRPGELLAVKAEELPAMPDAPTPDVTMEPGSESPAAPATPDSPAAPVEGPAESSLPTVSAPAAGTPAADAIPADPGVASINRTTQAAKAYRSAVELIGKHQYGEAEAALDYSIKQEALPEALLARGQLRYLRGEYRGAAADYALAAKLRPEYAEAVYSLAQATEKLGDSRKAAQLYGVALGLGLPPALEEYARSRAGGM